MNHKLEDAKLTIMMNDNWDELCRIYQEIKNDRKGESGN